MGEPSLDQGVIPFPSVDCRVLRTPAERCESARQIMGMVRDATCDQHQGANPTERPTIRVKASLQCSPTQHLQEMLPLVCGQAGRTPRHRFALQTPKIPRTLPEWLSPCSDSRTTEAHLACDGRVGQVASLPQSPGRQAAFLKWRASEMSWSPDHRHLL
jgi:hypothetical protein